MKNLTVFFCLFSLVFACACMPKKQTQPRRLYIEEGEYESDRNREAEGERREAPLIVESDYIYEVIPKDTYFFDNRNMPIDHEVRKDSDYKADRLWNRPKRFMQNTGSGGGAE